MKISIHNTALAMALWGGGIATTAAATSLTLEQSLANLNTEKAANYIGHADVQVRDESEFLRMRVYLQKHYHGVVARHHFELEPGQFVDCVDELSQPGAQRHQITRKNWVTAPSSLPKDYEPVDEASVRDKHGRDPGIFLLSSELPNVERDAEGLKKSCASGTIPKLRLTLKQMTAFKTLEHFRHKIGQPGKQALPTVYASPAISANDHEYAHAYDWVTNWGAESYLNVWKSYTEKAKEFSLSQIWVTDGGQETVEAGWQVYRNRHVFNPKYPYFFIYSTQDGYNQTGCYDLECNDFIQTNSSVVIGGRWTNLSVVGGAQYSTKILIQKDGTTGHWWIAVDGVYAGYYPRSLYDTNGIKNQADKVDFGAEIVNSTPHSRHTKTDMGSGYKPFSGFGYAAYQRNIRYVNTSNQYATPSLTEARDDSGCYDIDTGYANNWKTYFYFGGEGYNVSICP